MQNGLGSTTYLKKFFFLFTLVILSVFSASIAVAAPKLISFQTKIYKPDGTPLEATSVQFKFSLMNPLSTCVIYSETFSNVDLSSSSGSVVLALGDPVKAVRSYPTSGSMKWYDAFNNTTLSYTCQTTGTFSPTLIDNRRLVMQFNDGGGSGWQTLPPMDINSVPFAMFAELAETVPASGILQGGATPGQVLKWTGTSWAASTDDSTPSGSVSNVSSATSYLSIANGGTTPVLTINVGTGINTVAAGNDARITGAFQSATSLSGDLTGTLPNATIAPGAVTNSKITSMAFSKLTGVPTTLSGHSITMISSDITTALGYTPGSGSGTVGSVTSAATAGNPITVSASSTSPSIDILRATASVNGYLASSDFTTFNSKQAGSTELTGLATLSTIGFVRRTAANTYLTVASMDLTTHVMGTLPAGNGGTGQSSYTTGDLLYASSASALSRLPASATVGQVLTNNGTGIAPTWQAQAATKLSSLTAATATNAIDHLNFAQSWDWSTASTQNPMTFSANALTTGSLLNINTSSASLNSTNGLLSVANTGASTTGILARFQSNSAAGSGMAILANGNVGVGTLFPSDNLSIYAANATAGASIISDNTSTAIARYPHLNVTNFMGAPATGAGGSPGLTLINMRGTSSVSAPMQAGESIGVIDFNGSSNAVGGYNTGAEIRAISSQAFSNTSGGTQLYFSTAPNNSVAPVNRLSIDENGNVGIGISAPPSNLAVYKDQNATTALAIYNPNTGANADAAILLNNSVANTYLSIVGSGTPLSAYLKPNATVLWNDSAGVNLAASGAAGEIQFWTGGSNERMRILSSGNVGIGTTNPTRSFEVNGVIAPIDAGTKTYNGGLATEASSQLINMGINDDSGNRFGGAYTSATQGGLFRVDTRASINLFQWLGRAAGSTGGMQTLMNINSSGSVGIGIINPAVKLDVAGDIRATGLYLNPFPSSGQNNSVCYNSTWNMIGFCTSLRATKRDIASLDLGLDEILRMNPVTFRWKDGNQNPDLGFIAEEIEEVDPRLASHDDKGNLIGVRYNQLTSLLTRAMQQLYALFKQSDSKIKDHEMRLQQLESLTHALQFENEDLKEQNRLFKATLCKSDPLSGICTQ